MSDLGDDRPDLLVRARSALLDALHALQAHRASVVVIGAQAIYLRTAAAPVALAEATKDERRHEVRVAGTAALLVAKAHKIGERAMTSPSRLVDKDAHDVYRILIGTETEQLALAFRRLLDDGLSAESTAEAQRYLHDLFAAGPEATGSLMAGRAEEGIGEPVTVSRQTSILAADLLEAVG